MTKFKSGDRIRVYGFTPIRIIIHGIWHIHQPDKCGRKKAIVSKILNEYRLIANLEDGTEIMPYIKQCRKLKKRYYLPCENCNGRGLVKLFE